MNKQEYLQKWSEKLSLSMDEINAEFNTILEEEKIIHPDLLEDQKELRALKRLSLLYKKQLKSPAVGFEGIIIGASDCVDIIAKKKQEALESYRTDPQSTITEGITNENGVPLDTRETWSTGRANPQFGKPLPENNFLRNIWGIAIKSKNGSTPRFFSIVISGKNAISDDIPVFKPIRFMAIDKSEGTDTYKLNASQFTRFVIDEHLQLPKYDELLKNHVGIKKISQIQAYHDLNKDDFNRLVIIEGDVSILNLEPTSVGSRILSLEDGDATLEDLDTQGITCWLPPRIDINFAEGSKILIVGRTAQGKKKDEAGNATDELGDITLNTYGIYVIPEYKVNLPESVEPITEEALNIE